MFEDHLSDRDQGWQRITDDGHPHRRIQAMRHTGQFKRQRNHLLPIHNPRQRAVREYRNGKRPILAVSPDHRRDTACFCDVLRGRLANSIDACVVLLMSLLPWQGEKVADRPDEGAALSETLSLSETLRRRIGLSRLLSHRPKHRMHQHRRGNIADAQHRVAPAAIRILMLRQPLQPAVNQALPSGSRHLILRRLHGFDQCHHCRRSGKWRS